MLAVTGGKGGCGKTTTTLGLARALASRGYDPLVVDADVDLPDLHLVANVDREPTAAALVAGNRPETVSQSIRDAPGVAVLPAPPTGSDAIGSALARAQQWQGPVLVDCPAGAGPDATTPLRLADRCVLVAGESPASTTAARKTGTVARELGCPPVAAAVRDQTDATGLPVSDHSIERVPTIATGDSPATSPSRVLEHPQFRVAIASLSRLITECRASASAANRESRQCRISSRNGR